MVKFDMVSSTVLPINQFISIVAYTILVLLLFFSLGTVQCLYTVVGRRSFSTNAIIFCLELFVPIVFSVHLSPHAISFSVHLMSISTRLYILCHPSTPICLLIHMTVFLSFHVMLSVTLSWACCIDICIRRCFFVRFQVSYPYVTFGSMH